MLQENDCHLSETRWYLKSKAILSVEGWKLYVIKYGLVSPVELH